MHPRLTPARPDLAARRLEGVVEATRFADPAPMQLTASLAPLTRQPKPDARLDSELLFGERFEVYDIANGFAWGQSSGDGYVGYVPEAALGPPGPEPTHRVAALHAQLYPAPDLKTRAIGWLPYGAAITVDGQTDRFAGLTSGGYVAIQHTAALGIPASDWIDEALRFLGVPYVWGGRSSHGLDCSALIQLSRQAAGHETPRDSDMQERQLGRTIDDDVRLERGDLVFWKGHVGLMLDEARLLHANAGSMAVTIEPLDLAIPRIAAAGDGPVTRRARLAPLDSAAHGT